MKSIMKGVVLIAFIVISIFLLIMDPVPSPYLDFQPTITEFYIMRCIALAVTWLALIFISKKQDFLDNSWSIIIILPFLLPIVVTFIAVFRGTVAEIGLYDGMFISSNSFYLLNWIFCTLISCAIVVLGWSLAKLLSSPETKRLPTVDNSSGKSKFT